VLFGACIGSAAGFADHARGGLETAMERGLVNDAAVADSVEHRRTFWHLREILPEAQKGEGGSIKHDISVPVAAVPDFLHDAGEAVEALIPGSRPVPFGISATATFTATSSQPVGADAQAFLARWDEMNEAVHRVVAKFGGSISAEHGVGVMKRKLLPLHKDPVAFDVMECSNAPSIPRTSSTPARWCEIVADVRMMQGRPSLAATSATAGCLTSPRIKRTLPAADSNARSCSS